MAKYEQIMDKISGRLGPAYTTDRWGARTQAMALHQQQQLHQRTLGVWHASSSPP